MASVIIMHDPSWMGKVVSLAKFTMFNHCGWKVGDEFYQMWVGDKKKGERSGLVRCEWSRIKDKFLHVEIELPEINDVKLLRFFRDNANVHYDWKRTLSWPFASLRDLDDKNKMNCVELIYQAALAQGKVLWDGKNIHPGALAEILRARTAVNS